MNKIKLPLSNEEIDLSKEFPEGKIYHLTNKDIFDPYHSDYYYERFTTAQEALDKYNKISQSVKGLYINEQSIYPPSPEEIENEFDQFMKNRNIDNNNINCLTDYFRH
jgi:hypothetical protein